MANFGQRPFVFDIDGYMKVRPLMTEHPAAPAGELLLSPVTRASGVRARAICDRPAEVQENFHGKPASAG